MIKSSKCRLLWWGDAGRSKVVKREEMHLDDLVGTESTDIWCVCGVCVVCVCVVCVCVWCVWCVCACVWRVCGVCVCVVCVFVCGVCVRVCGVCVVWCVCVVKVQQTEGV